MTQIFKFSTVCPNISITSSLIHMQCVT